MPPIVHHPAFSAEMPAGHRFPMDKFRALAAVLTEDGLAGAEGFHRPEPVDAETLGLAHDPAYVRGVLDGTLPAEMVRRIGMPNSPSVALRARAAVGGTLLAARLALAHGVACNTAGGSHHADFEGGAGYCVFNDVAVAARRLLAEGAVRKVLVVDLDVHQGDGTARIFADDPAVFTFSMHADKNFPARKAASDLDIALADGTGDAAYLDQLAAILPDLVTATAPDLVFYNAGVDPHVDDKLGRLGLSAAGLARRDAYVLKECVVRGIPVTGVIGGGYHADIDRLARLHAMLHRAAQEVWETCGGGSRRS